MTRHHRPSREAAHRASGLIEGDTIPVKARRPKRRTDDSATLAAWSTLFESGFDFFDDLGFPIDAAACEAAPEAWARYGRRFLDAWQETDVRSVPWALEEF